MSSLILDASTLILMAKLDLLEILIGQSSVDIPEAVKREATIKPELDDARVIQRLIDEARIIVVKKQELSLIRTLETDFRLGEGEAQAIALAKSKNTLLGVDDRLAIKTCKILGVPFVTALAFIVRFHEKKILTQKQVLTKLEKLKQYGWYQKELLNKVADDIQRSETK